MLKAIKIAVAVLLPTTIGLAAIGICYVIQSDSLIPYGVLFLMWALTDIVGSVFATRMFHAAASPPTTASTISFFLWCVVNAAVTMWAGTAAAFLRPGLC